MLARGILPGPNVIKLFCQQFTNFHNKVKCSSLASFASLVYQTIWLSKEIWKRAKKFYNTGPEVEGSIRLTSLYFKSPAFSTEIFFSFFYKACCLNEEVNCTEPSSSVRIPWLARLLDGFNSNLKCPSKTDPTYLAFLHDVDAWGLMSML